MYSTDEVVIEQMDNDAGVSLSISDPTTEVYDAGWHEFYLKETGEKCTCKSSCYQICDGRYCDCDACAEFYHEFLSCEFYPEDL